MTDPTAPDGAADHDWFRSHVGPVLDAEPVTDAWAVIEARAHGDVPDPASLQGQRRWLAIAAVLALLAGLAVIVAATKPDDATSVTANAPDATGWYIPANLPEGWTLRTAWVTKRPTACGYTGRRWEGPSTNGSMPRLELTYTRCGSDVTREGEPGPALGHGVDKTVIGSLGPGSPTTQLGWQQDGDWMLIASGGLTQDDLVEAAKAIVANPASVAPPLGGFVFAGASRSNGALPGPAVAVSLETPSGQIASYRLARPGGGPPSTPFTKDEPVTVEGQPLPVELRTVRFDDLDGRLETMGRCCRSATSYLGTWPATDLQVPRSNFSSDAAGPEPTDEAGLDAYDASLIELISSLRPATTDEWRAFLATAENPPLDRLLAADTLADLTGGGRGPTTPRASTTTTTTTGTSAIKPTATTTAPDPARSVGPKPIVSDTGVSTPRDEEYTSFTELDDLDIRLELASGVIRAGDPVAGTLIMRNKTDRAVEFGECSQYLSEWGLVPASDPDRELPANSIIDCYGNTPNIGPKSTVRFPLDWLEPAGFVAQSGRQYEPRGTLPGGDYLAVVQIPGRTSDLRLSIPVTVPDPPCATSDEDVEAYLRHTLDEAKDVAAERGDEIRLASFDGKPAALTDDLRCQRINVDLRYGKVVNAVRH